MGLCRCVNLHHQSCLCKMLSSFPKILQGKHPLMLDISFYHYWGKARNDESRDAVGGHRCHLLAYHSLDVAAVGEILLRKRPYLLRRLSKLTGLVEEDFRRWFLFFLALHDVGKFAECFQRLNPEAFFQLRQRQAAPMQQKRHDALGLALWWKQLREHSAALGIMQLPEGSARRRAGDQPIDYWVSAVTGHHGTPPDHKVGSLANFFQGADFHASRRYLEQIHLLFCDRAPFPKDCDKSQQKTASWWISGITVLCDWLGSNTRYFPYCSTVGIPLSEYREKAKDLAEMAVNDTGLVSPAPSKNLTLHKIGIKKTHPIKPTPLQEMAQSMPLEKESGLFILEDVTGAGKTEAAVLLAHRLMRRNNANGAYFALPTMATANAMYKRLARAYRLFFEANSKPSLVLAHGASALSDAFQKTIIPGNLNPAASYPDHADDPTTPAEAHCNEWLADSRKKSLLADIGVGTIDQALLAILPSRHQSLRLAGLLGKILIVDEVHACDAYMHDLLCALLRFHAAGDGSAILLSATLPQNQKQKLLDAYAAGKNRAVARDNGACSHAYPLITRLGQQGVEEKEVNACDFAARTVNIKMVYCEKDVENLLRESVAQGKCACWIRNTVTDARAAYAGLKERHPNWRMELFHARFAMGDRLDIEARVSRQFGAASSGMERRGRVLIATQVVEQSLDVDWDVLITDLAPVDLMIQRAGRLCRHARSEQGDPVAGNDRRGRPTLHILSPPLSREPDAGWYAHMFKHGQHVYDNPGHLWLSASVLHKNGKIQLPEDARALVESVYGDDAQCGIPGKLREKSLKAEGAGRADSGLARHNALKIHAGFSADAAGNWWDEGKTPTRLGEETVTLYLARWQNNALTPWRPDNKHPWESSSVPVRAYWVHAPDTAQSEIPPDALAACSEQLPAKGKWGILLPLQETAAGLWQATALNQRGERTAITYTTETGLATTKKSAR